MEKLIVKDFLIIKSADFEVGRINLIIGPKASGKSLIAKLFYFFRKFLYSTYFESAKGLEKDIEKQAITDFEEYFPRYAWADQLFSIKYETDDISVAMSHRKTSSGQVVLKCNYSSNLISLHEKLRSIYRQRQEEVKIDELRPRHDFSIRSEVIKEFVFAAPIASNFNPSLFILAGRSFFANLQKNVFSFLASNIKIDPFVRDFGSQYERVKRFSDNKDFIERTDKKIRKQVDLLTERILVGK